MIVLALGLVKGSEGVGPSLLNLTLLRLLLYGVAYYDMNWMGVMSSSAYRQVDYSLTNTTFMSYSKPARRRSNW